MQRYWALKLDAPGKLGVKGGKSIVFKPLKASAEYFSRLTKFYFFLMLCPLGRLLSLK